MTDKPNQGMESPDMKKVNKKKAKEGEFTVGGAEIGEYKARYNEKSMEINNGKGNFNTKAKQNMS